MRPLFPVIESDLRLLMQEELARDVREGRVYRSVRIFPDSFGAYLDDLQTAVGGLTVYEFADALERLMAKQYRDRYGRVWATPWDAAWVLAACEMNFYYMRAVCADAVKFGHRHVEFVRWREVRQARTDDRWKEGDVVVAAEALASLRGRDLAAQDPLGIARKPHSGLTLRVGSAQTLAARRGG